MRQIIINSLVRDNDKFKDRAGPCFSTEPDWFNILGHLLKDRKFRDNGRKDKVYCKYY